MAHITKVNGTAYEISGGKTLINGTAYGIAGGRTLVGGTGYDISFLFSFTIDGIEYQAKPGMTWNDWMSSDYNTDGFAMYNNYVCISHGVGVYAVGEGVYALENYTNTIEEGKAYSTVRVM